MVDRSRLPFLRSLLWQGDRERHLDDFDVLSVYERGWRFRDVIGQLDAVELAYIKQLASAYGSWLEIECERLQSTCLKLGADRDIEDGYAASGVVALIEALRGKFILDRGLGLSGRTALFASIVGFDAPNEVSLTLVNTPQNVRTFREKLSSHGPQVLFDEIASKSFVFGHCYFDQAGMWVSIRPSDNSRAIKLAVHYDPRNKGLQCRPLKASRSKLVPMVAPEDELLFELIDAVGIHPSSDLNHIDCELIILLSGYVDEIEAVAKRVLNFGISPMELNHILSCVLGGSQSSTASKDLFLEGKARLTALLDQQ
jgi:hypothetical protein